MRRSLSHIAVPLLAIGLTSFACGGKSFEDRGGEPGGAGGGASGDAGSATGGSAVGGTDVGGSSAGGKGNGGKGSGGTASGGKGSGGTASGGSSVGGSGVGGSPACDALANQGPWTIAVRISNGTNQTIYLGPQSSGCAIGSLFQVADASGKALSPPSYCQNSCQDVIQGNAIGCPAIACAIGSSITLEPGESTMESWSGLFTETEMLPVECRPAGAPAQCQRVRHAEPGKFTFSAQAGTTLTCAQLGQGPCGACMPSSSGGCSTLGGLIGAPLISAKVDVDLGPAYGVGGSGGGMTEVVDLAF